MNQKCEFGPSKNTNIVKQVHQNYKVNNFVFRQIPLRLKFFSNPNNIRRCIIFLQNNPRRPYY